MAIYAKNITPEQMSWLRQYEAETGHEPMHQEELESGELTWREVVRSNVAWFETWAAEALTRIQRQIPGQAEDSDSQWSGISDKE